MIALTAIFTALAALPVLQHGRNTACKWNTRKCATQMPAALRGHMWTRNGYAECPCQPEELWAFFSHFVGTGPGQKKFDCKEGQSEGGADWAKNRVGISLGGEPGADAGLKDHIRKQMKHWKTLDLQKQLGETEQGLLEIGGRFFKWVEQVIAEARQGGDVATTRYHIMIYNYEKEKSYIGQPHCDVRLKATHATGLMRLLLPVGNCLDRPLLFTVQNGQDDRFGFRAPWSRVIGVVRGVVLMDAIGAGALDFVPAGKFDLEKGERDAAAGPIRFMHAPFATGAWGARGTGHDRMAATVVLSGKSVQT